MTEAVREGAAQAAPLLKRLSVKISYGSSSGAGFFWDAASQRRERQSDGSAPIVSKCEPNKVLIDAVAQLAVIAAVSGIPMELLCLTVSTTYSKVNVNK